MLLHRQSCPDPSLLNWVFSYLVLLSDRKCNFVTDTFESAAIFLKLLQLSV